MKTSELVQYLDQVPTSHRKIAHIDFDSLTVYHLTAPKNVANIKANGIEARSSSQSYDRPPSVYFFADPSDITAENIDILGLANGHKTITVTIPAKDILDNMHWDGLYNVTFGTAYSAIQYFGSIPTEWITEIS